MKVLIEKAFNGFILRQVIDNDVDFPTTVVVEETREFGDADGSKTDTVLLANMISALLEMLGEYGSDHNQYRLVYAAMDQRKDADLVDKVRFYGEPELEIKND